jgi:predicted GIY-YIG superfamily endonuclease
VIKDKKDQITFVSKNNPKNPAVFGKLMTFINCLRVGTNEKFNRIFGNVEFIPSKMQPPNLGDILQHSYYGTEKFNHGVKKCPDSSCSTCDYLEEGREANFPNAGVNIKIRHNFSCDSGYLLYKLTCQGCNSYYIGRTTCLKERLTNHKFKTKNKNYRLLPLYIHFFNCARNKSVKFKMMPYFKLHFQKISDMAIIERHHIDWLKPDLNTL